MRPQVEATGAIMSKMNADLESSAKDKERLQNLLAAEQHRSAGLGAHLNAAKRRLRDLEVCCTTLPALSAPPPSLPQIHLHLPMVLANVCKG